MLLRVALLALISLAAAQSVDTLGGIVTGAGHYVGCTMKIELLSGYFPTSITQGSGDYAIDCTFDDGSTCVGSVLYMASGQAEGCRDTTTGLPLMFGLEAALPEGVVAGGPVAVNPLTTLASVLYKATNGAEWDGLVQLVAQQLNVSSAALAFNGDVVQNALVGDRTALALQAGIAQVQNTVLIGASLLAGMLPADAPFAADEVADAVYFSLGLQMAMAAKQGKLLDLSNGTVVAETLASAEKSIQQVLDQLVGAPSRRLLGEEGGDYYSNDTLSAQDMGDYYGNDTLSAQDMEASEEGWGWNDTDYGNETVAEQSMPDEDTTATVQVEGAKAPAPAPLPQPSPTPVQQSPPPQQPPVEEEVPEVEQPDLSRYGKVGVVAGPIAILNDFAAGAVKEALGKGADPVRVVDVLARIMAVAQMDVAPSARQLGEGYIEAGEFQAYDIEGLVQLIQSVPLA